MIEPEIPEDIQKKIHDLGSASIVVGIPSFNNAATIGHAIQAVREGLDTYFPSERSIIVNADAGSKDATVEQIFGAVPERDHILHVSYRSYPIPELSTSQAGIPGKASAYQLIFRAARMLGVKACAVVDAELQSLAPAWIRSLIQPVLGGECDFVGPFYARQRFDGAMNTGIVYPLTRALYGKRIRFPIGGEFGFSAKLVDHYLNQEVWEGETFPFGSDIWMTTQAVCGGFRAGQAFLGKRVVDSKGPALDLSRMLTQILGGMFSEMERHARVWQRIRGSEAIPMYGKAEALDSLPVKVDVERMIGSYNLGFKNLFELWSLIIPPAALIGLKKLAQNANGRFCLSDELWAHILYDFAVAFHLRTMNRDHLLSALTPLYLGWVASYMLQMQNADAAQVEGRIEELCLCFEREKPYLISRWRWPDRFNP
jgi:glycosyltransferase involved in cell wall biosynthesis